MDRIKLLQNPLPINRLAARVIRKAKPEDVWDPIPNPIENYAESENVLRTKNLPESAPRSLLEVVGKRRGQMVVVGYAAEQSDSKKKSARWVVRCDCGRYEHRTSILRWLGTDALDMCRLCQHRTYKIKGEWQPRKPATRETTTQHSPATSHDVAP